MLSFKLSIHPTKKVIAPLFSHTSTFVFAFKILIKFILLKIIFTVFHALFSYFFTKTMSLEPTENIWRRNGHSKKEDDE